MSSSIINQEHKVPISTYGNHLPYSIGPEQTPSNQRNLITKFKKRTELKKTYTPRYLPRKHLLTTHKRDPDRPLFAQHCPVRKSIKNKTLL